MPPVAAGAGAIPAAGAALGCSPAFAAGAPAAVGCGCCATEGAWLAVAGVVGVVAGGGETSLEQPTQAASRPLATPRRKSPWGANGARRLCMTVASRLSLHASHCQATV